LVNQDRKASNLIEKLASNEEYVARLYRGYADTFPMQREFWISLAVEEMKHASWIRNLGLKTETRRIFVEEGRFNTVAIQTFMNYLNKELIRLNKQNIPLIEALSITLYIEQSLIESKSFEIFKTDSAELKHTLTRLRDDTLVHRNKAKEALEKYKKNQ
jgi:rubrerythrin